MRKRRPQKHIFSASDSATTPTETFRTCTNNTIGSTKRLCGMTTTYILVIWLSCLYQSSAFTPLLRKRTQPQLPTRLFKAATPSSSSDDFATIERTNPNSSQPKEQSRRDVLNIATHLLGCFTAAAAVSTYEDFDVTHLKPNRATLRQSYLATNNVVGQSPSIIGSATKGLAWNEADRDPDAYELQFGDQAGQWIQSYNEVMDQHREQRLPMWKKDGMNRSYKVTPDIILSEEAVKDAVVGIYEALRAVLQLKVMAQDYQWEEMEVLLKSPLLNMQLERSMTTLRSAKSYLDDEDRRDVIGFDWGSCAWRHCGAAADAQEALSELRCRLGLFEPFECLFVLDIVERSLRDVLAVVPRKLRPTGEAGKIEEYIPYQPRSEEEGNFEGDGDESDFLSALSSFRNNLLLRQ